MSTKAGCCDQETPKAGCADATEKSSSCGPAQNSIYEVVDNKVTLLIAAGAAVAANCEPCLNKIVADLNEAGVGTADIRRAVEIGQFVKDKPAARMKELADSLTGTRLAAAESSGECPLEGKKQSQTCG
jgi:alkylhydroperoxidase/carboxymuconolactone decarboxylase family protein YurZ